MVYEVASPNAHKTKRITKIVQSMFNSFLTPPSFFLLTLLPHDLLDLADFFLSFPRNNEE